MHERPSACYNPALSVFTSSRPGDSKDSPGRVSHDLNDSNLSGMMLHSDLSQRLRFASAAALICAFALSGCGGPAPAPPNAAPAPAASLPEVGAGDASVDDTSATFGLWDGGSAVVVWSRIPAGDSGSGTTDSGAEYHGLHLAPDGRQIEWKCTTDDGKTGSVTIDGKDYDLGTGRLFLAGVEGDETTVVQLDRDTSQLTDESLASTLEDWLENDDEVKAFFADEEN